MTLTKSVVNNALRDPLQGFDCDVYVIDQGTGQQVIIGRFVSFQMTVRNATEPYMEFNQRVARLLDGEFQFGWVLERGLIDVRILEDTFGLSSMSREQRISRSPRFTIVVEMNAPELDDATPAYNSPDNNPDFELLVEGRPLGARSTRKAIASYRLMWAKPDALTMGFMAGRAVVATRWEGLCEGIEYVDGIAAFADPGSTRGTGGNTLIDGSLAVANTFASANPFGPAF
jgi:hypothetical protein